MTTPLSLSPVDLQWSFAIVVVGSEIRRYAHWLTQPAPGKILQMIMFHLTKHNLGPEVFFAIFASVAVSIAKARIYEISSAEAEGLFWLFVFWFGSIICFEQMAKNERSRAEQLLQSSVQEARKHPKQNIRIDPNSVLYNEWRSLHTAISFVMLLLVLSSLRG